MINKYYSYSNWQNDESLQGESSECNSTGHRTDSLRKHCMAAREVVLGEAGQEEHSIGLLVSPVRAQRSGDGGNVLNGAPTIFMLVLLVASAQLVGLVSAEQRLRGLRDNIVDDAEDVPSMR